MRNNEQINSISLVSSLFRARASVELRKLVRPHQPTPIHGGEDGHDKKVAFHPCGRGEFPGREERKVGDKVRKLLVIMVALLATLLLVSTASAASYTRVLPNGLSNSPSAAKKQVQKLVSTDAGVQERLAQDHNLTTDEVAGAKVSSISRTSVVVGKTEDNSARTGSGSIVPSSYMAGQKVAAWKVVLHVSKSKTVVVKWKKDCSNPFLKKGSSRPPLRITRYTKTFTLKFSKKKVSTKLVECPSGQKVTVQVISKVSGRSRVRSITQGVKVVKQKLRNQIKLDVKNAITVKCAEMPPAPPAQITTQFVCPNGTVVGNVASCVAQSNSAEQTASVDCKVNASTNSCNPIIIQNIVQINANCSMVVYGDGSIVYIENGSQVAICSTATTQPSPQPTPSGKPPVGIPPEPPSNPAPGPDPSPSPQDPAPGPHMCYKPNGDPVSPVMVNGVPTCPPGSYGA